MLVTAWMTCPLAFSCVVRVRMPVRSLKYKEITRRYAADVTLAVANEAAHLRDAKQLRLPGAVMLALDLPDE